jgi:hypothetical protein
MNQRAMHMLSSSDSIDLPDLMHKVEKIRNTRTRSMLLPCEMEVASVDILVLVMAMEARDTAIVRAIVGNRRGRDLGADIIADVVFGQQSAGKTEPFLARSLAIVHVHGLAEEGKLLLFFPSG